MASPAEPRRLETPRRTPARNQSRGNSTPGSRKAPRHARRGDGGRPRASRGGNKWSSTIKHGARLRERIRAPAAARFGRGLPVHVARAIGRLIRANGVEIVPAAAGKTLQLAAHQRQNLIKLLGGLDRRKDDHAQIRRNAAGFFEEAEREARSQLPGVLAIDAATREEQFHRLLRRLPRCRQVGEIDRAGENLRGCVLSSIFANILLRSRRAVPISIARPDEFLLR